ncbi:hypothetical protein ACQUEN_01035 [Lactococcus taiwanensis]|uniref:hypothetical protein n=1 Tax=Lactococcus taiwanensis TaxID=1151742 RepID=UPI0028A2D9DF|nr:hypothetical protein [Lactococcus taiwanensis]
MKKELLRILIPVFIVMIPLRILLEKSPKLLWVWTVGYFLVVLVLYGLSKKVFK